LKRTKRNKYDGARIKKNFLNTLKNINSM